MVQMFNDDLCIPQSRARMLAPTGYCLPSAPDFPATMNHDHRPYRQPRGLRADDPRHNANRSLLRGLGVVVVLIGGGFILVGGVDFFSSFGSFHAPTKFWCFFVGMPLAFVGGNLLRLGYLGAVTRFVAEETVPVVRDSAVDVAEGLRPTIRDIAADVRGSGDPSARLARLEQLRSDGLITEVEHAEQRARILREL